MMLLMQQALRRLPVERPGPRRAIRSFDQVDSEGFLLVNLECCVCDVSVQVTGTNGIETWGQFAWPGAGEGYPKGWDATRAAAKAYLVERGCWHASIWPKANVTLCPPAGAEGSYP